MLQVFEHQFPYLIHTQQSLFSPSSSHTILQKMKLILTLFLFFTTLFTKSTSSQNSRYNECSQKFSCGDKDDLGYPFYDGSTRPKYCGYPGFELDCSSDNPPKITISGQEYNLTDTDADYRITVSRNDTWQGECPDHLTNSTMDLSRYIPFNSQIVRFFYDCKGYGHTDVSPLTLNTTCDGGGSGLFDGYYLTKDMLKANSKLNLFENCLNIFLFVTESEAKDINDDPGDLGTLIKSFRDGFDLELNANKSACRSCIGSNGVCGYDFDSNKFVCHCDDHDYSLKCGVGPPIEYNKGSKHKSSIAIGVGIGAVVLLALLVGCVVFARRRQSQLIASQKTRGVHPSSSNEVGLIGSNGMASSQAYTTTPSTTISQTSPSYSSSVSDLAREKTSYFGVHVFDYSVLEHATCNFHDSKELGEGGFGTVYYGVLPDGRQVAVKRLYENSFKRVEQFMNEIRILAEIHHKNLVALYGCTSRRSRELLLVYEYVSNGTVADHIHGKLADSTFLPWHTRLNVAIETAEALAFLHRKDVIHRDVKTTNILLDNEFHVKVADFGLSRLFPMDMTHVSTAPQGTPGYVDPEYYQCYKLTEKSDVYSFGVVLIELISSKRAVDITRHRHHVNLANMALDWIQNQEMDKLVDPRIGYDKDHSIEAMVNMVGELGFRCLQQDRDMRPTMDEVMASLRAIQLEGLKAQKQEVVDIVVYGDDVGLLTNPTPPLSPELPRSNDVV